MDRPGAAGGRETLRRHGVEHFKELGKRGFASLVAKNFAGDRQAAITWLHNRASESHVDRLLSERLDKELETADVACVELPVFCDPDLDPTFDGWQGRSSRRASRARSA